MQKEQGLFLNYALIPNSLYSFYVDDVKVKLKPLNVIADKKKGGSLPKIGLFRQSDL